MPTSVAPSYLINQCVAVSNDSSLERLRSASHGYLTCPCTKFVGYGNHSFGVSGPKMWNQLLVDLRDPTLSSPRPHRPTAAKGLNKFCEHLPNFAILYCAGRTNINCITYFSSHLIPSHHPILFPLT